MYDITNYTVLITYQIGGQYEGYAMQQLVLHLSDYSEEGAICQAKAVLALNENIQQYIINIMPAVTTIKTIK